MYLVACERPFINGEECSMVWSHQHYKERGSFCTRKWQKHHSVWPISMSVEVVSSWTSWNVCRKYVHILASLVCWKCVCWKSVGRHTVLIGIASIIFIPICSQLYVDLGRWRLLCIVCNTVTIYIWCLRIAPFVCNKSLVSRHV
jgi:hypothetical protein